ncbi:MAG: FkbM family methyltransferase [Parachlamydiaceae bacterium]|nr:FkbM family methyltransferase [Parachlamydiaceae bacterium]
MKIVPKVALYLYFFLIFCASVMFLGCSENPPSVSEHLDDKPSAFTPSNPVFVGLIIKDNDQLIPYFLKTIENLEYRKELISIQIDICNSTDQVKNNVFDWVAKNKSSYKYIAYNDSTDTLAKAKTKIDRNRIFGKIKDGFLTESKNHLCSHCLILTSHAFINPETLKHLIQKKQPIIAPLLRPVPEPGDLFRNFFADVTPSGYYQDHPDYFPIASRKKRGTFKVPCVHEVYLILTQCLDQVNFSDNFVDWEFLSFSKNARNQNVDQYICNEKEFGFILHFKNEKTLEKEKKFTLKGIEFEINSTVLNSLLSKYYQEDPYLRKQAENFNFKDYAIYHVQKKDLFYVDDVNDYIKNNTIKQGVEWEGHIHQQFKKYVKPGSVVLDIGGHIGTHALNLSKIVGEEGQVHVFEPQGKMFCELAINMYLNRCNNVVLHHNALGIEEKWIEMFIPKEAWVENLASDFINQGHGTVTESPENFGGDRAKMIRLDDLNLNNISFIKMDVEGYEMNVIKGGIETIKSNKPIMIVEIFNDSLKPSKIKFIENLGYIGTSLNGDDYLFFPSEKLGITPTNSPSSTIAENTQNIEPGVKQNKLLQKKKSDELSSPMNIAWEGTFMDLSSLSHVNRSITRELAKIPDFKLTCVGPRSLSSKLSGLDELQEMRARLQTKAPNEVQFTIRHAWPPNWQKPVKGKWILMQPWEFGALPEEWVRQVKKVDEIWVPTHFVKRQYIESGVPEEKVVVVPNGIDPSKFHSEVKPYDLKTKKKFKFLFLGGTIYRKGPDLLLSSYQKAFSAADDVCLVIKDFGTNAYYANQTHDAQIKEAQNVFNAPEIIYLTHEMSVDEIASVYRACDCLVYPYRGEGFALPVLEAMACGIPVLVTEGGATDDFVNNEVGWFIPAQVKTIGNMLGDIKLIKDGWLLEPDTEALSAQMRWLAKNPKSVHAKGIAACKHAHLNWTWEKAAQVAANRLHILGSEKD